MHSATGTHFRRVAGRALGVDPDSVLIGNGSDDILTILTRAFVPEGGLVASPSPSYTLYRTLAEIQANFEFARGINGVENGRIRPMMAPSVTITVGAQLRSRSTTSSARG